MTTVSHYSPENYSYWFENFHEYIIEEYASMFRIDTLEDKYSIPTEKDIIKGAYEELYQYIAGELISKLENEEQQNHKYKVSSELYSNLFDQYISQAPMEENPIFHQLCRDTKKYFTLYQMFYRDGDELIHQPITEVW